MLLHRFYNIFRRHCHIPITTYASTDWHGSSDGSNCTSNRIIDRLRIRYRSSNESFTIFTISVKPDDADTSSVCYLASLQTDTNAVDDRIFVVIDVIIYTRLSDRVVILEARSVWTNSRLEFGSRKISVSKSFADRTFQLACNSTHTHTTVCNNVQVYDVTLQQRRLPPAWRR